MSWFKAEWVGVLITALGVGVAAWYAWLTRRLWQATRAQTELTRNIFEAERRPYVAIRFDALRVMDLHDARTAIEYRVFLKNQGRSPAIITAMAVEAKYDGQTLGQLDLGVTGMYLFPDEEQPVNEPLRLGGDPGQRGAKEHPVVVEARVVYADARPASGIHVTAATFTVRRGGIFVTHQVVT